MRGSKMTPNSATQHKSSRAAGRLRAAVQAASAAPGLHWAGCAARCNGSAPGIGPGHRIGPMHRISPMYNISPMYCVGPVRCISSVHRISSMHRIGSVHCSMASCTTAWPQVMQRH